MASLQPSKTRSGNPFDYSILGMPSDENATAWKRAERKTGVGEEPKGGWRKACRTLAVCAPCPCS